LDQPCPCKRDDLSGVVRSRIAIIGNIHGCIDELKALLELIESEGISTCCLHIVVRIPDNLSAALRTFCGWTRTACDLGKPAAWSPEEGGGPYRGSGKFMDPQLKETALQGNLDYLVAKNSWVLIAQTVSGLRMGTVGSPGIICGAGILRKRPDVSSPSSGV
jgi:hypothetical protein